MSQTSLPISGTITADMISENIQEKIAYCRSNTIRILYFGIATSYGIPKSIYLSRIFNLTAKYCVDIPMTVDNDRNMQQYHNKE